MSTLNRAIDKTRDRVELLRKAHRFLSGWSWGLLAAGGVVLAGKITSYAVVIAGLAVAALTTLIFLAHGFLRRRTFTPVAAAVLLDRKGRMEGWPLLALEFPESEWNSRRSEISEGANAAVPRVSLRLLLQKAAPGVLFFGVALAVPQQELFSAQAPQRRHQAAHREIDRLTEKVEKLKERGGLPPKELDRLREELQTLRDKADERGGTQESWEGIDNVAEQLQNKVQERESEVGRALAASGELRSALDQENEALKAEELQLLRGNLQAALQGMPGLDISPELRDFLNDALAEGADPGDLDPQKLRDAMEELQDFLQQEMERLARERQPQEGEQENPNPQPGAGEPGRGRGDAPLELGDPSPELKRDLKPEFLPKGKVLDPESSELLGVSAAAPKASPQSSAGQQGADGTVDEGALVLRRHWSAAQQESVRKYFSEE